MPPRSPLSSALLASAVMIAVLAAPMQARAQTLIDFLWGGSSEWGGSRQTVSFNSKYTPGQIIVSFGDRRLYHITRRGQATSYPIAVPKEQARWQGVTRVSYKRVNPSWRPTPEMIRDNPRLPRWVPGGHPMNPLGVRALYLGSSTYRIHGTDAPWTIGQAASSGCIRMYNKDVLDLYPRVKVGTRVTVTWQRFKTSGTSTAGYSGGGHPKPLTTPVAYKPRAKSKTSATAVKKAAPTTKTKTAKAPAATKPADKPVASAKTETKPASKTSSGTSTLGVRAGAGAVPGGAVVSKPDKSAKASPASTDKKKAEGKSAAL